MKLLIEKLIKSDDLIYLSNYNYYLLSFNDIGNINEYDRCLYEKERNNNLFNFDDMIFEKPKVCDNYIEVPKNCNIYNFEKAKYYIDISEFKNIELFDFKTGYIDVFEKLYLKRNIINLINDEKEKENEKENILCNYPNLVFEKIEDGLIDILQRINIYEGYDKNDSFDRIELRKYLNLKYIDEYLTEFINYLLEYDLQLFNSSTGTEIKNYDDLIHNSSDRYSKYKNYVIIKTKSEIEALDNIFSNISLKCTYYTNKYYKSFNNLKHI